MRPLSLKIPFIIVALCSSTSYAERSYGRSVASTVSDWAVQCSGDACVAHSGLIEVWCQPGGIVLRTLKDFEVEHWHNRMSQKMPTGRSLDAFQAETLMSGGQLVVVLGNMASVEEVSGVSLDGFEAILSSMNDQFNCVGTKSPLGYQATVDDRRFDDPEQLVPFTKPQVEFAVRAQTGAGD